jgi:hypothetical protein
MPSGPRLSLTTEVDSTGAQKGLDDFKSKVKQTEKESADAFSSVQNKVSGVATALGSINPVLGEQAQKVAGLLGAFQGLVNVVQSIAPGLFRAGQAAEALDTKFKSVGNTIKAIPSLVNGSASGAGGVTSIGGTPLNVNVIPVEKPEEAAERVGSDTKKESSLLDEASDVGLIGAGAGSLVRVKQSDTLTKSVQSAINSKYKVDESVLSQFTDYIPEPKPKAVVSSLGRNSEIAGLGLGIGTGAIASVVALDGALAVGVEKANSLVEASRKIGVSTGDYQDFTAVTTKLGISTDDVNSSMSRLRRSIASANDAYKNGKGSTNEYAKSLATLGVTQEGLKSTGGDVIKITNIIRQSYNQMSEEGKKAVEADIFKVYGKNAAPLIELLKQQNDQVNRIVEGIHKLSGVSTAAFRAMGYGASQALTIVGNLGTSLLNLAGKGVRELDKYQTAGANFWLNRFGYKVTRSTLDEEQKSPTTPTDDTNDPEVIASKLDAARKKAVQDKIEAMSPQEKVDYYKSLASDLTEKGKDLNGDAKELNDYDVQDTLALKKRAQDEVDKAAEESANKQTEIQEKAYSNKTQEEKKSFDATLRGLTAQEKMEAITNRIAQINSTAHNRGTIGSSEEDKKSTLEELYSLQGQYDEAVKSAADEQKTHQAELNSLKEESNALDLEGADNAQKKLDLLKQQHDALISQRTVMSSDVDLQRNSNEITKNEIEQKNILKATSEAHNASEKEHYDTTLRFQKSLEMTPGLLHRGGGSGGGTGLDPFGHSAFKPSAWTTEGFRKTITDNGKLSDHGAAAASAHVAETRQEQMSHNMSDIASSVKLILIQTKNVAQNNVGSGDGSFFTS